MVEKNERDTSLPGYMEANSFEAEFGNFLGPSMANIVCQLGGFHIETQATRDGQSSTYGVRDDGTTIEIVVKKGERYRSPASVVKEYEKWQDFLKRLDEEEEIDWEEKIDWEEES